MKRQLYPDKAAFLLPVFHDHRIFTVDCGQIEIFPPGFRLPFTGESPAKSCSCFFGNYSECLFRAVIQTSWVANFSRSGL
jgi:hypothetical protein